MSITRFFERLGAPVANSRWSWGAQRASDGAVFLRVWQDKKLFQDGQQYMLLQAGAQSSAEAKNPGYRERLRHIDAVRRGAPCYLVMCIARDVYESPRVIEDFHDEHVFIGRELLERDGNVWVRVSGRKPVSELTEPPSPAT